MMQLARTLRSGIFPRTPVSQGMLLANRAISEVRWPGRAAAAAHGIGTGF